MSQQDIPYPAGEYLGDTLVSGTDWGSVILVRRPAEKGIPGCYVFYRQRHGEWFALAEGADSHQATEKLKQLQAQTIAKERLLAECFAEADTGCGKAYPEGVPIATAAADADGAENLVLVYRRPNTRMRRHRWIWFADVGGEWETVTDLRYRPSPAKDTKNEEVQEITKESLMEELRLVRHPLDDNGIHEAIEDLGQTFTMSGLRWTGDWLRIAAKDDSPAITAVHQGKQSILHVLAEDGTVQQYSPDDVNGEGQSFGALAIIGASMGGLADHPVLYESWQVVNAKLSPDIRHTTLVAPKGR